MKTAELNIQINEVSVVIKTDDSIEFPDAGTFTIEQLQYIVNEAKAFKIYRKTRIN